MQKRLPNYTWLTWVAQGIALVLGIIYCVMMVVGKQTGLGGLGTGRDIALIILGVQALAFALIGFILVAALAYGVYRLKLWLREALRQLTAYARMGHRYVEALSHKIAAPFIAVESKAAQGQAMLRGLRRG